jgi:hypothetical protein
MLESQGNACRSQMRFEALTAVGMKITGLWNVTICNLMDRYKRFGGTCCLFLQGGFPAVGLFKGNLV